MKKLLSFLFLIVCLTISCFAQDPVEILKDFINKTGLCNHHSETLRMEMTMEYQGTIVPLVITFSSERKNMRLEMNIQQTEVAMVVVGDEGWIEAGDQKQPLPSEFISSTKSLTFFASISELLSNCSFVLAGESQKEYEITVTSSKKIGNIKVYVDRTSGMINKVVMSGSPSSTLSFSQYKTFSDVMMPSRISTETEQQVSTTFTISKIDFGVKLPDWYFKK